MELLNNPTQLEMLNLLWFPPRVTTLVSFTRSLFDGLVAQSVLHQFRSPLFHCPNLHAAECRKNNLDTELNTFTHLLSSFCSSHGVSFSVPCYPSVQSQGQEHSCDVTDTGERDDGAQKRDTEDLKLVTSWSVPPPVNSQLPHVRPRLSVKPLPKSLKATFVWPLFLANIIVISVKCSSKCSSWWCICAYQV